MRDRGDNREFRDRRHHHHHHHVDRNRNSNSNSDATRRHKPPPRLVRLSGSPPIPIQIQAPHRSSSYRRDLISRQSDHHQEYPSPHHPRRRRYHSPTARDYHDDLHVPGYMHPHPDYPTDLSHGLDPHPHPLAGHKAVLLDDRPPSRSYPETLKQDSILDDMLPGEIHDIDLHHRHGQTRELYGGDRVRDRDRDRDRGRDRDTGKNLYQREVPHPHPVTVTTTHLGPLDGGQSSYGHGRLCYEHTLPAPEDISRAAFGRLPDDLRKSRDRLSDHYNNLALDDMYGKMPYTSHDYFRVDGTAYSPKTAREGRVYSDLPHHSTHKDVGPIYHGFEQGSMARPLHRRDASLPFEDSYKFQREVARVAEREMPQSPIFPDCAKRLHHTFYSPSHNGYANDLGYEPSLERMMAREHQLRHVHDHDHDHDHDHVHNNVIYDDSIFEDDDDDVGNDNNGDEDGHVSNPRITVKDRLNLPSPLLTEVDHPIIRRAGPSRKPVVIHGKHHHSQKMAVPAAMRINSVKKRLQSGPLDLRRENFRAHKLQRRGMEDEPNIRKVNYEYENCPDEDAANTELRDPLEGSEEFNKQVEKAFFKYAKIVNGSSREKKKFLQPGKGSVVCCVCGRQSKEFAETHNLVVHAFHTRKPGLRAAHLGLQKALCLLMGWNWLISPDESKQYQLGPPKEAKVLKQDLILWPPIVVIRNSSIDNFASESKTISIDLIRSMLKEMGIEEGKAKVSYGKPSNLSVILVKFPPIRSGFELAGKLHNHFYQAKHGKEHLHDLLKSGNSTTSNKKANEKEIEDVLYGYMAGIEDLENLDSDTKKTYLAGKDTIRSKKVMEARANEEAAA